MTKKKTKTVKIKEIKVRCRTCNREFTYPNRDLLKTRKGKPTFCFNCGEISVYTENLTLRAPTKKELANIDWPSVEVYRKFLKSNPVKW